MKQSTPGPDVETLAEDRTARVRYRVMAYRKLTPQEVNIAVGTYVRQHGVPKRDSVVTIISVIGFAGS